MTGRTGWPGCGRSAVSGLLSRLPTLFGALSLILLALAATSCGPTQSFERSGEGSTVYLDTLDDAAKAAARQKIVDSLRRGVGTYTLDIGDEVEVFFHISSKPTAGEYRITAGDKLRVDFLGDTENSRDVQVAPDGRIALPLVGSVMAGGQSAGALAHDLEGRYRGQIAEPKITINIIKTHTPLDDFIEVLNSASSKGRSVVETVLPDGTVAVPLLSPLKARGRTPDELGKEIDEAYAARRLGVFVSVVPRTLVANAALVVGEVSKPGRVELDRPTTVLMAVGQAGGALPTGSMTSVRLYYLGKDGQQHLRSINLKEIINDLTLEDDMIVPNNSVIYVPPTELAQAGRFLDATLRDILRFGGFSVGAGFQILPPSQGAVTIFQSAPSK